MTYLNNKCSFIVLLVATAIIFLLPACVNLQNTPEFVPDASTQNNVENQEISNTKKSPDKISQDKTKVSDVTSNEAKNTENQISSKQTDLQQKEKQPSKNHIETVKTTPKKSDYPTLTDDQIAMSVEELLNDPDLIKPLVKPVKNGLSNYNADEDDSDSEEEFGGLEEINFDEDFNIPEFAQKLLDNSYPDYYPPTGKLFGFMRRHLLKRGDSPKPWTVTDDFNGDKKPDWAALMVNKEKQLDVIVIYSEDDKYRLEVLFEGAGIDNNSIKIALSQEKPGAKTGASYNDKTGQFKTATLEFPGINIMYYTKSSSLFYWDKYYFDELLTSK